MCDQYPPSLETQIQNLAKSLDGSYKALSERVARLERLNLDVPQPEPVCVTLPRHEAIILYNLLGRPDVHYGPYGLKEKVGQALGYIPSGKLS